MVQRWLMVLLLGCGLLVAATAEDNGSMFVLAKDNHVLPFNEELQLDVDPLGAIVADDSITLTYTIVNAEAGSITVEEPVIASQTEGFVASLDGDDFAGTMIPSGESLDFSITLSGDGSTAHAESVHILVTLAAEYPQDDVRETYQFMITASVDAQPPQWLEGYPALDEVTTSSARLTVAADEPATVWLVVLEADAPAPSPEQVRAGQDAAGDEADMATSFTVAESEEREVAITQLAMGSSYHLYLLAEDDLGNAQEALTVVELDTEAVPLLQVRNGGVIANGSTQTINGSVAGIAGEITYELHNQGALELDISAIELGQVVNAIVSLSPESSVLAPGEHEDLGITITVLEPGDWSVVISVASNDPEQPEYTWTMSGVAIAEGDPPPPSALNWLPDFPLLSDRSPVSLTFLVQADGIGVAYYLALDNGAPAPSAQQVRDGVDGEGTTQSVVASGNVQLLGDSASTVDIAQLSFDTTYDVYFVALSSMGNLQQDPTVLTRSTDPMDEEAPQWQSGFPRLAGVTANAVEIDIAADKPGIAFAVALAANAAPPSAQQVRDGIDGEGLPAAAHSQVNYTQSARLRLQGLAGHGSYHVYVVASNTSGVLQSEVEHDALVATTWYAPPTPEIRRSEGFVTQHNAIAPGSAEAWQRLRDLLAGQSPRDMRAWYWQADQQRYQELHPDDLELPTAQAVFFAARGSHDLDFSAPPQVGTSTTLLHQGWNFIGISAHAESADGGQVVHRHGLSDLEFRGNAERILSAEEVAQSTLNVAWQWDASARRYQAIELGEGDEMVSSTGYWIYNDRDDDTIVVHRLSPGDADSALQLPVLPASDTVQHQQPPPPPGAASTPAIGPGQLAPELHSNQ